MDIVRERLEREYDLELLATSCFRTYNSNCCAVWSTGCEVSDFNVVE
jgi:translation elongation factor EF-4